jgi:hypothetical protein
MISRTRPEHGGLLHHLEVVQKKSEGRVVRGQRGHGVEGAVGAGLFHAQALRGLGQAIEKARDVVVGAVQREPGGGGALRLHALADLRHGGGLAEAGGRAHEHQLDAGRGNLLADGGARHLRGDERRRVELGFENPGERAR